MSKFIHESDMIEVIEGEASRSINLFDNYHWNSRSTIDYTSSTFRNRNDHDHNNEHDNLNCNDNNDVINRHNRDEDHSLRDESDNHGNNNRSRDYGNEFEENEHGSSRGNSNQRSIELLRRVLTNRDSSFGMIDSRFDLPPRAIFSRNSRNQTRAMDNNIGLSSSIASKKDSQKSRFHYHYDSKKDLIRDMLSNFLCPFNEDDYCRFEHHKSYPCEFFHPKSGVDKSYNRLPPFVCVFNLINRCRSPSISCQGGEMRCKNGFHLDVLRLLDLKQFESENEENLREFYGGYSQLECTICSDKICNKFLHKYRCWALLESCSHFTCLPCMRKWRKVSHSCPLCRIVSNRYLWSYYSQIPDENRKKCLFDRRDYHVIEDEPPAPIASEPLDDIEVIYRYEDDGTILYLEDPYDDYYF
uniref:NAD-dependent protein deacetylase Sir2B-like n=1 Tax=Dermatophagoides pteronyssinus TaxID=6956 RepID=A0A6P6YAY4_DERPT|nr:NAD-dependent protein deacetylase Sir2B-like [Dermatophagoides pteronyssinus]XP_027202441.1 NAD-dependent protein deacetylase Sir2B-like [Dermatophagoides pteronyssinus]